MPSEVPYGSLCEEYKSSVCVSKNTYSKKRAVHSEAMDSPVMVAGESHPS